MNKQELLTELDSYLAIREPEDLLKTITLSSGHTVKNYQVKGVFIREDNRVERCTLQFHVYREGEAQEGAYYEGNPIASFWQERVQDYLHAFQGRVLRGYPPIYVARLIIGTVEKWVVVEGSFTGAPWNPENWAFSYMEVTLKEVAF